MSDDATHAALLDLATQYSTCTRCAEPGVLTDARRMAFWHLAESARPAHVRVLFVAESPPQRNRRVRASYFYLPHEQPPAEDPSSLFWALAEALALPEARGTTYAVARRERAVMKPRLLAEFRARGMWLVDAAKCAVNGVPDDRLRQRAVGRCAETWLMRELSVLAPDRIVLVKATVNDLLEPMLTRWGLGPRLLAGERIPHPGSGQRANFRAAMRRLIARHPALFLPVAAAGEPGL